MQTDTNVSNLAQASPTAISDDGRPFAIAGTAAHLRGELPLALQHYRAALACQCRTPLRLLELRATPAFDSVAAQARLWGVLVQLAGVGVHAFATSGTLLGLVREGGLLPFDKDLDIGLPFAEMPAATDFLLRHGWHRATAPRGMVNPVMLHDGQGLSLDLCGFIAESSSGLVLGGFWLQGAPSQWQRVTEYPALQLRLQRRSEGAVWAVTNPEAWLAALYGPDWRQPVPDFDTVIGAHNLRGFALLTQCYALGRIYERWLQGKLGKAIAITAQSLRHSPDDALLLQVQQHLASQLVSEAASAGAPS